MSGSGGLVEIRCGPAEYHAEIFITTLREQKRWTLADLMGIESVRNWLLQNRGRTTSDKSRLEAKLIAHFRSSLMGSEVLRILNGCT
jgi:hypothetical protein